MKNDDAKRLILARRARFVAATLAGAGVISACGGRLASEAAEADPSPGGGKRDEPRRPAATPPMPTATATDTALPVGADASVGIDPPRAMPDAAVMFFDAAIPSPCLCVPVDCIRQNRECGLASDGCGSVLNCGVCPAPLTCNGFEGRCHTKDGG